jgi:hypothetical protein
MITAHLSGGRFRPFPTARSMQSVAVPYREGMRTRALYRWGMMVALALAVILMHHVPEQHDRAHETSETGVVHVVGAAHHEAALPVFDDPLADSGHSMLHLCMAIVVGMAVLLLAAAREIPGAAPDSERLRRTARSLFRPPSPVPRRLAVLCVLRR